MDNISHNISLTLVLCQFHEQKLILGQKHSNLSKPAFGNLLHCRFHTLTAGSRFFWQLMSSVGSPKLPNTVTVSNLKTPSMLIANSQCFWQLMSSVGSPKLPKAETCQKFKRNKTMLSHKLMLNCQGFFATGPFLRIARLAFFC